MTSNPLLTRKTQKTAAILFVAWTTALVLLFFYTLNFSWVVSIADSLITNTLLALSCLVISVVLRFYQPKDEIVLFVIVLAIALSLLITWCCRCLLTGIFAQDHTYVSFLNLSLVFRFIVIFVFLAWCAFVNVLWYRLEGQSEMQERLFTAQNLAKEAELNKLRHQLQPHFLFNSLNSVYALTIVNPKEAGTMITKLASFLRGTLKRDDEVWVSVAEEMDYIQLYLDIEKVRFSHRLNIDIQIEEDTLQLSLPGTLLQPIVENAIKFGLYNTSAAILISILVSVENNLLVIRVENPFDPETKATDGTGFGLTAIRRRLYLLFADNTLLQTSSTEDNKYITTLKIPQKI
ncbi:sensor histidine kinase [Pedobacter cryoconitis]|uniref:Histidine kinase n=1 Tax=Pedobacter cryoconitis TaxID=188932 RepID=A0A327T717_9SPHI|nr:histidine kinase [Pedobacter cryoconitis]RAJ37129.1 histidine kinase [Pedobacter cryoconitis]